MRNLVNNQFTRVTSETETTIDHILTNLGTEVLEAGVIQVEIADHLPIFMKAKMFLEQNKNISCDRDPFKRLFTTSKKDSFCETFSENLGKLKFNSSANNGSLHDADEDLKKLISTIQYTYDKVYPLVKISRRNFKKRRKPWMNHEVLSLIKTKHKLYKKYSDNKTPENLSAFKMKRNSVKREIEKAKKTVLSTIFQKGGWEF